MPQVTVQLSSPDFAALRRVAQRHGTTPGNVAAALLAGHVDDVRRGKVQFVNKQPEVKETA